MPKQLPRPVTFHLFDSIQYPLPLIGKSPCRMQPPKLLNLGFQSLTTHSPLQVSTNHSRPPLDQTPTIATFRRTSMPSSSFLPLPASLLHMMPINQIPPLPPPTLPTLHHPTLRPQPTSSLMIDGSMSTSFLLLQLPFLSTRTPLRHFLPLLAAHRATGAPRLLPAQPPPPALGSRTHAPAPQSPVARHHPQLHSNTLPQCTLYQNVLRHHFIKPTNYPPPVTPYNPCLRRPAGPTSKGVRSPRPHQQHRPTLRPHLRIPGQHTTMYPHSSNIPQHRHLQALHLPPILPHLLQLLCSTLLPQRLTRRGAPCLYISKTTILRLIPGTPTITDRAAAASGPPAPLDPLMIYMPRTFQDTAIPFSSSTPVGLQNEDLVPLQNALPQVIL